MVGMVVIAMSFVYGEEKADHKKMAIELLSPFVSMSLLFRVTAMEKL